MMKRQEETDRMESGRTMICYIELEEKEHKRFKALNRGGSRMKKNFYPHIPFSFFLFLFNLADKKRVTKKVQGWRNAEEFSKIALQGKGREWVGCNNNGKWRCLETSAIMNEGE